MRGVKAPRRGTIGTWALRFGVGRGYRDLLDSGLRYVKIMGLVSQRRGRGFRGSVIRSTGFMGG